MRGTLRRAFEHWLVDECRTRARNPKGAVAHGASGSGTTAQPANAGSERRSASIRFDGDKRHPAVSATGARFGQEAVVEPQPDADDQPAMRRGATPAAIRGGQQRLEHVIDMTACATVGELRPVSRTGHAHRVLQSQGRSATLSRQRAGPLSHRASIACSRLLGPESAAVREQSPVGEGWGGVGSPEIASRDCPQAYTAPSGHAEPRSPQ